MSTYKRIPLKPFPNGRYVVAHTDEIKTGKSLPNGAYKAYCEDVSIDFNIWETKIYIDPPICKGDGR